EILERPDLLLRGDRHQIAGRDDTQQNRPRAFDVEGIVHVDRALEVLLGLRVDRGRRGNEQQRAGKADERGGAQQTHQRHCSVRRGTICVSSLETTMLRSSVSQSGALYRTVWGPTGRRRT